MILIDASVYIFRAYHALPDSITGRDGRPLNVVYGFADFLVGVLEAERPERVAAAFDESLETSFRNELYPDYKANRESAPPELKAQIEDCRRLSEALGVIALASERYEADDLIGTLARRGTEHGEASLIVSSDKDLAQLLGDDDVLWDYARDIRYDPAAIRERFGVRCEQMRDYLALVGDPIDNIPGVPGIGAKGAAALLAAYEDLDAIYADLQGVGRLPIRGAARVAERLADARDAAFLSRELASIDTAAPLPANAEDIRWRGRDADALAALCDELDAGERLRRRLMTP